MKTAKKIKSELYIDDKLVERGEEFFHTVRHTFFETSDIGKILVSEAEGYFPASLTLDEVFIFPVDNNLEVTEWLEMEGSQRPCIPAKELMKKLGYEVTDD